MTGPVLVAAMLLLLAGAAKAWRPSGTARALAATRLPASPALVRGLALVEVGVGAGAMAAGGPFTVAMACSYGAFAVFVGAALVRGWSLSSCGCFGEPDAPPTVAHVVIDVALAGVSLIAALQGLRPPRVLSQHPAQGAATVLIAAVTAGLLTVVLSVLPSVVTAP